MPEFIKYDGRIQLVIPLRVKPHHHQARHTLTGSALSKEAGTVFYGYYDMEYLLPHGDKLRLIANHDKKTVQLLLFTHNAELIKYLPGTRSSSLVANIISKIHQYRIHSSSYKQPLSTPQKEKLNLANHSLSSLISLLELERTLAIDEYEQQEELRQQVFTIIDEGRNNNRLIADNPVISEGQLGLILSQAYKETQNYQFNRVHATSYEDQLEFSQLAQNKPGSYIVWDSDLHIGHDKETLNNTLRVLCDYYQLSPIKELNNLPANRFSKMLFFMQGLWKDGRKWLKSLAIHINPSHKTEVLTRSNGLSITKIEPYYTFKGIAQKGYKNLNELIANLINNPLDPLQATTIKEAQQLLESLPHGHWVIVPDQNKIVLRLHNRLHYLSYFIQDQLFFPSPDGQDLYDLSQLSKRHLYWPERIQLKLKGFFSTIPQWFKYFYSSVYHFISYDLQQDFINHIHQDHLSQVEHLANKEPNFLHDALKKAGFLAQDQSIEAFIKEQLHNSPYIIAQANHSPSPLTYHNPFHRMLGVLRHIAGFFIDTTERNPTIGVLAMAAYLYGAGAILAPSKLAALLSKLHLNGLIAGIEPTQKLAHFMSHGTTSEAISASATFWQGTIAGGNLDKFFINAIDTVDPTS